MKAKKRGRPKMLESERRGTRINFRLTSDMRKSLEKAAKREGKKLSAYIEDILKNHIENKKG
jgi:uncharacterized protein (DUF1778 family)